MTSSRTGWARATTGVAAGVLLAACSSSGGSGTSGSASPSLTGSPVKIMTWSTVDSVGTNLPGVLQVAQAAEKWINANGGLSGHPVTVETCNLQYDANSARDCAQKAVDDGVIAVVGSFGTDGATFYPILQKAGIPYLGGTGGGALDLTSPESFPVNSTISGDFMGSGVIAGLKGGCQKLAVGYTDIPAAQGGVALVGVGFQTATGKALAGKTPIPLQNPSWDSIVASTTSASDCVSAILGENDLLAYLNAFQQAGKTQKVASYTGALTQNVIDQTNGATGPTNGALLSSWYPAGSDPVWDSYRAAVKQYAPDTSKVNIDGDSEHSTWIGYQVLYQAAKHMTTFDAAGLSKALNTTASFDTAGLTPTLSWSKLPYPGLRVPNFSVWYQTVTGGKIVDLYKTWYDMSVLVPVLGGKPPAGPLPPLPTS